MRRENFKILVALTSVTQAGLCVFTPMVLLGLLAKFLINKFSAPDYLFLVAIIIGVFSGFYNMIKYIYIAMKKEEDE